MRAFTTDAADRVDDVVVRIHRVKRLCAHSPTQLWRYASMTS